MAKLHGPKLKYKGGGKGDMYRKVDRKKYAENYDRVFNKRTGKK